MNLNVINLKNFTCKNSLARLSLLRICICTCALFTYIDWLRHRDLFIHFDIVQTGIEAFFSYNLDRSLVIDLAFSILGLALILFLTNKKPFLSGLLSYLLFRYLLYLQPLIRYGGTDLLVTGLLFIALAYYPFFLNSQSKINAHQATDYFVYILRAQLLIVYFVAGINKAIHPTWQSGQGLLVSLQNPNFSYLPICIIDHFRSSVMLLGATSVCFELLIPFLLIIPTTRLYAIWAAIIFHTIIGLTLNVHLFTLIMICYLMSFSKAEVLIRE